MKSKILILNFICSLNLFASGGELPKKYTIFAPFADTQKKITKLEKRARGQKLSLEEHVVNFIQKSSNLDPLNSEGFNFLENILKDGRLDLLQKLIDAKFDLESEDNFGHTPLFLATILKKYSAMRMLIAAGAQVNNKIADTSLLHYALGKFAVEGGCKQSAKILLRAGAQLHENEEFVSAKTHETLQAFLKEISSEDNDAHVALDEMRKKKKIRVHPAISQRVARMLHSSQSK